MTAQDDKSVIRQQREEVWRGNFDLLEQIYAPECIYHDSADPFDLPGDPEGIKHFIITFREAFPDLEFVVEHILLEEDEAAVRWRLQGTHIRDLPGLPPTAQKINISGQSMLRFEEGLIIEEWTDWDALGLLRQLGLVELPFTPVALAGGKSISFDKVLALD